MKELVRNFDFKMCNCTTDRKQSCSYYLTRGFKLSKVNVKESYSPGREEDVNLGLPSRRRNNFKRA